VFNEIVTALKIEHILVLDIGSLPGTYDLASMYKPV
jgi:hypothetical protein